MNIEKYVNKRIKNFWGNIQKILAKSLLANFGKFLENVELNFRKYWYNFMEILGNYSVL